MKLMIYRHRLLFVEFIRVVFSSTRIVFLTGRPAEKVCEAAVFSPFGLPVDLADSNFQARQPKHSYKRELGQHWPAGKRQRLLRSAFKMQFKEILE